MVIFTLNFSGNVSAAKDGDFEYNIINGDEAEITNYIGSDKDVIIPDEIDGHKVTGIGNSAFEDNQLTSVEIPEGVTSIGGSAFKNNQLTSVEIPESVTSIGSSAFRENQLASVEIPKGVKSIGIHTFSHNKLESVEIPEGVTSIWNYAFSYNKLKSVEIPEGITSIQDSAFSDNQLSSVGIPESVTSIGGSAFSDNQLSSVEIPESVTSIGSSAFSDNQLTSVEIPEGVTSIGRYAFSDNQLQSVKLLNPETTIADNPFRNNQVNPTDLTIIGYTPSTAEIHANSNGYSFQALNVPDILIQNIPTSLALSGGGILLTLSRDIDVISIDLNDDSLSMSNLGKLKYQVIDNRGFSDSYELNVSLSEFKHKENNELTIDYSNVILSNNDGITKEINNTDSLKWYTQGSNEIIHSGEINIDEITFDKNKFIKSGTYETELNLEIITTGTP